MGLIITIFGALLLQIKRVAHASHAHMVHGIQTHLLEMITFVRRVILVHLVYNVSSTQSHFGMDRGVEVMRPPAVYNTTGIPWFHKRLSAATTDFIELRICCDSTDEDTPVGYYDIFVK